MDIIQEMYEREEKMMQKARELEKSSPVLYDDFLAVMGAARKDDDVMYEIYKITSGWVCFWGFTDLFDSVLHCLKHIFHDKEDWIFFFALDLNWGREWKPEKMPTGKKDIPLETITDLYCLLSENYLKYIEEEEKHGK